MVAAIFFGLVISLVVSILVAKKFADIAEMKGHAGSEYFWWVFLTGILGILMVIALPNENATFNQYVTYDKPKDTPRPQVETYAISTEKDPNKHNAPMAANFVNGEKVCPKCGQPQRSDRRVCWSCGQHFDN